MTSGMEKVTENTALHHSKSVHFPEGLPAFEEVKDFLLVANEEEAPFMWLQALAVPNLAFVVVDPFLVHPDYQPDLLDSDVESLKIEDESDVFILSIVNLRHNSEQGITANLVGPIVINWKERIGKQVILKNHLNYSVKYRLD